jgi:hypothetical protein
MIVLLAATAALAAKKPLDWQTGKVLDTQRNRYFAGTIGSRSSSGSTTTGTTTGRGDMTTGTATTNGTAWYSGRVGDPAPAIGRDILC